MTCARCGRPVGMLSEGLVRAWFSEQQGDETLAFCSDKASCNRSTPSAHTGKPPTAPSPRRTR
jgi:hypothetical protein